MSGDHRFSAPSAALVASVILVGAFVAPAAFAHGATRGLHLHLQPERVRAGSTVIVSLDADEPIRSIRASVVGGKPVTVRLKKPSRTASFRVVIPRDARGVVNVHAEVVTWARRTRRASAILHVDAAAAGETVHAPERPGR